MFRRLKLKIRGKVSSAAGPQPTANEEPDTQEEPEEPGLYQLNEDGAVEDAASVETNEVDIVAIHGLNGTAFGTWTHKNKTFWLKDLLLKDVRGARIFTYHYPSRLLCNKSEATIEEYAKTLLLDLKNNRSGPDHHRRPIIFIAHSLGGIVCKEALIIAQQDRRFTTILDSTQGVIFFGTPHRGARKTADLGVFLADIVQTAASVSGARFLLGDSKSDLIENLRSNSPDLRRITDGFRHLHSRFHIVSVFETEQQKYLGRLIVDQDSAILGIQSEDPIPGYKSHTEICRYSGPLDQGYIKIRSVILDLCKRSSTVDPLEASERACIGLFRRFDLHRDISSLSSQRVEGTCEWILENPQYQAWAQETQASLLWISGHPSCGKTILSSYVTEYLASKRISSKNNAIVCYYFCIEDQRGDAKEILGSIIFQILVKRGDLIRHVETALKDDRDGSDLFQSFDSLWRLFTAIIDDHQLGPVIIIIDALDECNETSRNLLMGNFSKLLDRLRSSTLRSLKFLVTSRPDLMITKYFSGGLYEPLCLPIDDAPETISGDLSKVIRKGMSQIAKDTQATQADISKLEMFLNENADQSFLWVKLNLDILDGELSTAARDFQTILADVPRGLTLTYRRFMGTIQPKWKKFAYNLLETIIASLRPLRLEEIGILISTQGMTEEACHAVRHVEEQPFHPNIRRDISKVLGSLIRISDSRVYLVHVTLKKFLLNDFFVPSLFDSHSTQHREQEQNVLGRANMFLASACMAYLSLGYLNDDVYSRDILHDESASPVSSQLSRDEYQFEHEEEAWTGLRAEEEPVDGYIYGHTQQKIEKIDADTRARVIQRYKFFEYAATSWAEHFALGQEFTSQDLQSLALRLSDKNSKHLFSNWFRFFWTIIWPWPVDTAVFDQLAVAAFFGHVTLLKNLLDDADFIDMQSLGSAIYWASRNGHDSCVMKLLKTRVLPDSCVVAWQSALCSAADIGHLNIVKALATDSRVDINFRGKINGTPLFHAAGSGHVEIVKFLLSQRGIEVNPEDNFGYTPLMFAVSEQHNCMVETLLADDRVDVNHASSGNRTAMREAIAFSNTFAMSLLLRQPGFDADFPCHDSRTPLADAAMKGIIARIKQLKSHKAPLSFVTVWNAIPKVVALTLKIQQKLNNSHSHADRDGRTAISLAAEGGHDDVIRLLLKYKVPGVDKADATKEWTPLFWAIKAQRNSTVQLLLETPGVNVNHKDHSGRSALSWAVSYGSEAILQVLLDASGVDPLVKDNEGLTALD